MQIINVVKNIMKMHKTPPELHKCPHCGAPLTRLTLVSGGIIRLSGDSKVKAVIGCRDCHCTHPYRGSGVKDHWLILQLQNQTRSKVSLVPA